MHKVAPALHVLDQDDAMVMSTIFSDGEPQCTFLGLVVTLRLENPAHDRIGDAAAVVCAPP